MNNKKVCKKTRKMLGGYFKGTKKRKIKYANGELPTSPIRRNRNFIENMEYEAMIAGTKQ